MRMHDFGDVAGGRAHLNRQHAFRDQFARVTTGDADAENALRLRVDDQLRHAIRAVKGQRPTGSAPREFHDLDNLALCLRFRFGQTAPRHLWISEHHGRNDDLVPLRHFAANHLDSNTRLFVRLVRQHDAARDVADGADDRVGRLHPGVHLDETLLIALDLGVLQAKVRAVRHAANRDEHTVIELFCEHAASVHGHFDLLTSSGHLCHLGLEANLFEILLCQLRHWTNEVRVSAGENRIHRLDHDHLAAQPRVNGAEFHADVATANDEQALGNFVHIERLGRGHDARIPQVERLRHRRL